MQEEDLLSQSRPKLKKGESDLYEESLLAPKTAIDMQRNDLDILDEGMRIMTREDVSSIAVHDLIEEWLPLFMGWKDEKTRYSLKDWVAFAGTEHSYVNVLGKNGEVMFQVPPLHPPQAFVDVNNGVSIEECSSVNQLMMETSQIAQTQGDIRPVTEVFDVLANRFSGSKMEAFREEWKQFFKNMGLWDLSEGRPDNQATSQTRQNSEVTTTSKVATNQVESNISPSDFIFD